MIPVDNDVGSDKDAEDDHLQEYLLNVDSIDGKCVGCWLPASRLQTLRWSNHFGV